MKELPAINWNIWEKTKTVNWFYGSQLINIDFNFPPISVVCIKSKRVIAIATHLEELKLGNLQLYSFDGKLIKIFEFPNTPNFSYYTGLTELENRNLIEAQVCFPGGEPWLDAAAVFNIETGTLSENFHRTM
jgi:hypothetical protein